MMTQLARDALLVHGPLAHRLGIHQLRNELETVAFQRLFPEQFNEVSYERGSCPSTALGSHVARYFDVYFFSTRCSLHSSTCSALGPCVQSPIKAGSDSRRAASLICSFLFVFLAVDDEDVLLRTDFMRTQLRIEQFLGATFLCPVVGCLDHVFSINGWLLCCWWVVLTPPPTSTPYGSFHLWLSQRFILHETSMPLRPCAVSRSAERRWTVLVCTKTWWRQRRPR